MFVLVCPNVCVCRQTATMETVPEANGKEGKEEVVTGGGGTNGKADVVLDPFVNGPSAKEQGSSFHENEQMIKSLERQGGWKTCLLVFLSILSVLLFCTVIFVSLDRAKYVGFPNRDCGGAGSSGSYFVPSPPAPGERSVVLSKKIEIFLVCSGTCFLVLPSSFRFVRPGAFLSLCTKSKGILLPPQLLEGYFLLLLLRWKALDFLPFLSPNRAGSPALLHVLHAANAYLYR